MPNVWDNPFPEWTLETGGSMYFIPDAAPWPGKRSGDWTAGKTARRFSLIFIVHVCRACMDCKAAIRERELMRAFGLSSDSCKMLTLQYSKLG